MISVKLTNNKKNIINSNLDIFFGFLENSVVLLLIKVTDFFSTNISIQLFSIFDAAIILVALEDTQLFEIQFMLTICENFSVKFFRFILIFLFLALLYSKKTVINPEIIITGPKILFEKSIIYLSDSIIKKKK